MLARPDAVSRKPGRSNGRLVASRMYSANRLTKSTPSRRALKDKAQRTACEEADIRDHRQRAAADPPEPEGHACEADRGQQEARQIERPPRRLAHVLDKQIDQEHAERADRDIDKKN